jgi:uncharacterized protein (DUF1778 family)
VFGRLTASKHILQGAAARPLDPHEGEDTMLKEAWISTRKASTEYEKQRKQNKRITVRMTGEQYDNLQNRMELAQFKQNDFILRAITEVPIVVIDGVSDIIIELKRIGNNLNQLTRLSNSDGSAPSVAAVKNLEDEVEKIWQHLRQLKQRQV